MLLIHRVAASPVLARAVPYLSLLMFAASEQLDTEKHPI